MYRTLDDPDLDDGDRKLLSDIDRVGWHVVLISEEGGTPGWAFTVGLYKTYQHPEVVVFGLPLDVSHHVLNYIGDAVKAGRPFTAGTEYEGMLEGVRCTLRPVNEKWYKPFLGYAGWYYRGPEFPVLQCIWPDRAQRFPWEKGFKAAWIWAQPLLFESEPGAARVEKLLESMS